MKIIIAENKKAKFEYFILKEFEAGIVLFGSEVKSLRQKRVNISDAYIVEIKGEIWLHNMHISEYKAANKSNHEPKRQRKLLLHKKEIKKIINYIKIVGMTAIPLFIYFNEKGLIKSTISIVKGKKLYDKRLSIKNREFLRKKNRFLKNKI